MNTLPFEFYNAYLFRFIQSNSHTSFFMRRSGSRNSLNLYNLSHVDRSPYGTSIKKDPVTGQNYIHIGCTVTTWKFCNIHENPNFIS